MPPTNRITKHFSRELEPVDPAELQAALQAQLKQQEQQWLFAYRRGSEDGYACGWVHAAVVFLGLTVAAAVWRSL